MRGDHLVQVVVEMAIHNPELRVEADNLEADSPAGAVSSPLSGDY